MGMQVYCDHRELWAPSVQVGKLFFAQMKALETVVGMPSGIENPLADMLEIEAATFGVFLHRLLDILDSTNNGPLLALATGCTEVALALYAEMTGQWPTVSGRLKSVLQHACTVMNALPEPVTSG